MMTPLEQSWRDKQDEYVNDVLEGLNRIDEHELMINVEIWKTGEGAVRYRLSIVDPEGYESLCGLGGSLGEAAAEVADAIEAGELEESYGHC